MIVIGSRYPAALLTTNTTNQKFGATGSADHLTLLRMFLIKFLKSEKIFILHHHNWSSLANAQKNAARHVGCLVSVSRAKCRQQQTIILDSLPQTVSPKQSPPNNLPQTVSPKQSPPNSLPSTVSPKQSPLNNLPQTVSPEQSPPNNLPFSHQPKIMTLYIYTITVLNTRKT